MNEIPTIRCPFCGEEILEIAKICKHCKSNLEQISENPKEEPKNKTGCCSIGCLTILILLILGTLISFFDKSTKSETSTKSDAGVKSNSFQSFEYEVKINPKKDLTHLVHWTRLRDRYPFLQGDKLCWRDLSRKIHVAVPVPFWNELTNKEKQQFAEELDYIFDTHQWEILTGRLVENNNMMLDVGYSRSEIISLE